MKSAKALFESRNDDGSFLTKVSIWEYVNKHRHDVITTSNGIFLELGETRKPVIYNLVPACERQEGWKDRQTIKPARMQKEQAMNGFHIEVGYDNLLIVDDLYVLVWNNEIEPQKTELEYLPDELESAIREYIGD